MDKPEPLTDELKERRRAVALPHLIVLLSASRHQLALMEASLAALQADELDVPEMYGKIFVEQLNHQNRMRKAWEQAEYQLFLLSGGNVTYESINMWRRDMKRRAEIGA